METTFDLRNGKTLNKKVISFDGTLLSESFLKPLFGIYDKYKVGIGIKAGKAENSNKKLDISTISDNVKLKLTNKRSVFILVEETIIYYPTKENSELNPEISPINITKYYFQRIWSDKHITLFQSKGKNIDNLIRNRHTVDNHGFTDYRDIDGFYIDASIYGMIGVKYTNMKWDGNAIVKDIIFNEV
jgi:hypothetical protein